MRSPTSSCVSPSSTEAMALPRGTVEVEPLSLGKFSRVKQNCFTGSVGGSTGVSGGASGRAGISVTGRSGVGTSGGASEAEGVSVTGGAGTSVG